MARTGWQQAKDHTDARFPGGYVIFSCPGPHHHGRVQRELRGMDKAQPRFQALLELALAQHCVVAKRQARTLGIDHRAISRAIAAGKLSRDLPGVYRVAGSEVTWESQLMAALLWLGREDSAVSHRSAAALWGLPGFKRGPIELSTGKWKKPLPPVVVHRVGLKINGDTTTVGPIRVTNAGRTLVDVAGDVTPDILEAAIENAIRRRLTSWGHLRWLCKNRQTRNAKGLPTLRKLLADSGPRITESEFEVRLLQALRRAGLPAPEKQYQVRDADKAVARVDFAYPGVKIAIEADSYTFHSGRDAWESDLIRRNRLSALGWQVMHVTHRQLEQDLNEAIERVRAALMPNIPTT